MPEEGHRGMLDYRRTYIRLYSMLRAAILSGHISLTLPHCMRPWHLIGFGRLRAVVRCSFFHGQHRLSSDTRTR